MAIFKYTFPLLVLLGLSVPSPAQPKAANGPQRLYVVTYIDVYPNFAEDTKKLLTQFAADSRKDDGFVRMEILVDVARTNHFTLTEVWQSRQAFEAHSALPHTKQMRDKMGSMIGAPFDERLYTLVP